MGEKEKPITLSGHSGSIWGLLIIAHAPIAMAVMAIIMRKLFRVIEVNFLFLSLNYIMFIYNINIKNDFMF